MKKIFAIISLIFAVFATSADESVYYNAADFKVIGTLAPDARQPFSRLPDEMKDSIRKEVWDLGLNSAGIAVRFATDTDTLRVRWKSHNSFRMNHMTATGIRGLDLYVLCEDSTWTFVNSGRPNLNKAVTTSRLVTKMPGDGMREYMLYLSLYDGVDSLEIGVDSTAVITPGRVNLPVCEKPIVMYGTSILQGGCATRPGMAHTNILERKLNREVINLGFSGNARLDMPIAHLMASCDASCYVIDVLPNCTSDILNERLAEFYSIIRSIRPDTPIIFVESPLFPVMRFDEEVNTTITEKNATLKRIYNSFLEAGDSNIYYFEGEDVFAGNPELTVDNYHFTDYGFTLFAERLLPVIQQAISK